MGEDHRVQARRPYMGRVLQTRACGLRDHETGHDCVYRGQEGAIQLNYLTIIVANFLYASLFVSYNFMFKPLKSMYKQYVI
jgi:hypothetical protein